MSIAHELSCDIAAAMLAEKEKTADANPVALSEIVLAVYATLRQMTNAERDQRRAHSARATTTAAAAANTGGARNAH